MQEQRPSEAESTDSISSDSSGKSSSEGGGGFGRNYCNSTGSGRSDSEGGSGGGHDLIATLHDKQSDGGGTIRTPSGRRTMRKRNGLARDNDETKRPSWGH